MAPPKHKSKIAREEHLEEVARLDRRGYSTYDIARKLGVTQGQVSYDIKKIRDRYAKMATEHYAAKVAQKRVEYREVRKEAWEAWERSKEDARRRVEETGTGGSGSTWEKTAETTEGRLPDNSYLKTIVDTLKAECDLEGLNKPLRIKGEVSVIDWNRLFEQASEGDGVIDAVEQRLRAIDQTLGVYTVPTPLLSGQGGTVEQVPGDSNGSTGASTGRVVDPNEPSSWE
jgi:predicted transcriptional regulator